MPDQNFRAALDTLRQHTRSGSTRSLVSVLVRAVAVSKPAARAVVSNPLRSRAERRQAIIDAARAIRAADEGKAAE
jgi:hypothetical protein